MNNSLGQLGLGYSGGFVAQPVANPNLSNVVALASGNNHMVALLANGTVRAWGNNASGQVGPSYSGLTANTPQTVPLTCVVAISANGDYSMALRADGTLWAWGRDDYGQLGTGILSPSGFSAVPHQVQIAAPVAKVACGISHCVALLANGTVLAWGQNGFNVFGTGANQPNPTPINLPAGGIGTVVQLASSSGNSALLTASGQVYTWGANVYGQIGNGTTTAVYNSPVAVSLPPGAAAISVATTENSVCARTSAGLLVWGSNASGELGDPNCASAATLAAQTTPVPGPALTGVAALISLGDGFLVTLSTGQVRTWGSNTRGQLGYATPVGVNYSCTANAPVGLCPAVPSLPQALPPVAVSATSTSTCAGLPVQLTATGGDGQTYTWAPATGLSATTGATVTATLGSTVQYTVSSGCGAPAIITIGVSTDCCVLEQVKSQDLPVVEVGGTYADFASSPFNAPAGTFFHATQDVTLLNDLFPLAAGSVFLFEAGVSLHLDEQAQLRVQEGATLTAACQEMWGGVQVHGRAGGIYFSSGATRATLSHSYDGVVLDEAIGDSPAPYFYFKNADFQHNRRSLTLHRWQTGAASADAISGCSFDSDPQYFKAPWQYQSATNYYYSEAHLIPEGDLRDMQFTGNRFANCQVGIWMEGHLPAWFHLTNSLFEDFQVAGISSGHPQGWNGATPPLFTPGSQVATYSWKLEGNRFRFPAVGLQPAQQACDGCFQGHSFYPYTTGVLSQYYGLEATSNKFEQLHADSTDWISYAQLPAHVGIWALDTESRLERNRFYLLANGAWVGSNINTPTTSYLMQNAFLNCARGLVLGDFRFVGGGGGYDGTAALSCNTYLRNDNGSRSGDIIGIHAALMSSATLLNNEDLTGLGLLKEYFGSRPLGSGPGLPVVPLVNTNLSGLPLRYFTFDNYRFAIQNACTVAGSWNGINVNVTAPQHSGSSLSPVNADPSTNTCNLDGFSDTGIQNRSSVAEAIKKPQSVIELAQNVPNPASNETSIAYELPPTVRQATLLVREGLTGREVLRQPVEAAHREVHLNLRSLPNGLYFYTIVADGVPTRTRRLLVNRQ